MTMMMTDEATTALRKGDTELYAAALWAEILRKMEELREMTRVDGRRDQIEEIIVEWQSLY